MLGSLFDFAKDMGKKIFTSDAEAGMNILKHIEANNPGVNPLSVEYDDGVVTMSGVAKTAEAKEKAILMAGNVEGVESVNADAVDVDEPIPAASGSAAESGGFGGVLPGVQYYTIEKGDTLYAVAKQFYGDGMKYPDIFEANREVIEDPDKIYPGQKIRIPSLG